MSQFWIQHFKQQSLSADRSIYIKLMFVCYEKVHDNVTLTEFLSVF